LGIFNNNMTKQEKKHKWYIEHIEDAKLYAQINKDKIKKYNRLYRLKHKEEIKEYFRIYQKTHKKERTGYIKKYGKIYYEEHIEEIKKYNKKHNKLYYEAHKEERKKYNKQYRNLNKEKINKCFRIRIKTDINFKISCCLRVRIRKALKGINKSKSTIKLLGCSIDQLKQHLESQFKPGMSWNNYGYRGWHVDHNKPCASFDLSIPEEQLKCFNYTNLQPLWAEENLSKGSK